MAGIDEFAAGGLHEMTWDTADALVGGLLVASPLDAEGRGLSLAVTHGGDAVDLGSAAAYLVWRHRETRKRGCERFSAVDASAGRFTVHYPAAMACDEGTVEAQIMLSWGDRALSSRVFAVRVERTLVGDAGVKDGFSLFIDAIKRFESAESLALDAVEAGEFNGTDGKDGLPGKDGDPGKDGLPGKDGAPGADGLPGKDGAPGQDGPMGPAGPAGPMGPAGPVGPKGDAFAYEDFTSEQLEALRGPRGEKGDAGKTGPVGEQGPKGEDGTGLKRLKYYDLEYWNYDAKIRIFGSLGLNVGDFVVDRNDMLAYVFKLENDGNLYEYTFRCVASLRGKKFYSYSGLDLAMGEEKKIRSTSLYPDCGDFLYSSDTGCVSRVMQVGAGSGSTALEVEFRVVCVARFGVEYATKAYVDEAIASISNLEEVEF